MHTEIAVPVGHKDLRLLDLMPDKDASFSPNLYRWMRRHAHFYRDGGVAESVYRVREGTPIAKSIGAGTLMIGHAIKGYPGDTDFLGVPLMAALCTGGRAGKFCHAGMASDLDPVEGFWNLYLQIGRCAIDPAHVMHFSGSERYLTNDDHRECLWCGHQQRKIVTPRTVLDESWV